MLPQEVLPIENMARQQMNLYKRLGINWMDMLQTGIPIIVETYIR